MRLRPISRAVVKFAASSSPPIASKASRAASILPSSPLASPVTVVATAGCGFQNEAHSPQGPDYLSSSGRSATRSGSSAVPPSAISSYPLTGIMVAICALQKNIKSSNSASTIDGQKLQVISLSGMREDAVPGSQASRRCQAHRRRLQ